MDRGTLIRSHVVARPRAHPPLAAPVPLAHRLRAAADVAAPAPRGLDRPRARPQQPGGPRLHRHRPAVEGNGEAEELKAFQTGGFLGTEFGPFRVPYPADAVAAVRPPGRHDPDAVPKPLQGLPGAARGQPRRPSRASDYQRESLLRSLENADRLLNSDAAKAFDLSLEPKASYDNYNTGRFGLGCLLARRLTEAGPGTSR